MQLPPGITKTQYTVGMMGVLLSIVLFFVALFYKQQIGAFANGYGNLIYPTLICVMYFFANYWYTGKVKTGVYGAMWWVIAFVLLVIIGPLVVAFINRI